MPSQERETSKSGEQKAMWKWKQRFGVIHSEGIRRSHKPRNVGGHLELEKSHISFPESIQKESWLPTSDTSVLV